MKPTSTTPLILGLLGIILITLFAFMFCGCASYQSRIVVGSTSWRLPKDAKFDFLQVTVPTTNGPLSLVISNGSFAMNPATLNAATAHDVALINAAAQAVGAVAGAAAKP